MSLTINTRYEFQQLSRFITETETAYRTGRLVCQKGREEALLYFEMGKLVHATYDTLTGESVLYALLSWNNCAVSFEKLGEQDNYDTSHSLDHQQVLLFKQTLELLLAGNSNHTTSLQTEEGFTYKPRSATKSLSDQLRPINLPSILSPLEQVIPADEPMPPFTITRTITIDPPVAVSPPKIIDSTPPKVQPLLLYPAGKMVKAARSVPDCNPDAIIQQTLAEGLTGYLLFTDKKQGMERVGLVLLKQGMLLAVRVSQGQQLFAGQAAYDAIVQQASPDMTVTSFETNGLLLEAFLAVLGGETLYKSNQQITTNEIAQIVQTLVQKKRSGVLKLNSRSHTLYYLIGAGTTIGCFELEGATLQPSSLPFTALVNEDEAHLVVLTSTAYDSIKFNPVKPVLLANDLDAMLHPNLRVNHYANPSPKNPSEVISNDKVEQGVDWINILTHGRKPYSKLPTTLQNFKGLCKSFEKGNCTGLIEICSGDVQFHYLIEKGIPIGLYRLNPATQAVQPSNASLFDFLDRPDYFFNIYLEVKTVPTQQFLDLYLEALRNGTFNQAVQTVQKALYAGLNQEVIYDAVFAPAMRQVGLMWEKGKMTVAQEHLATGITEYCRNLVLISKNNTSEKHIGRVLLTSVSGNNHLLGLNLLSDVFRWRGWEIFPLFSELPEIEIAEAAFRYEIDLVCLSVSMPSQITKAMNAIKALRQSGWNGLIEVGGPAFVTNPSAFKAIGADFLGTDAETTVAEATRLLSERGKPTRSY